MDIGKEAIDGKHRTVARKRRGAASYQEDVKRRSGVAGHMDLDKVVDILYISGEEPARHNNLLIGQYRAHGDVICVRQGAFHLTYIEYEIMSEDIVGVHEGIVYYRFVALHDGGLGFIIESVAVEYFAEQLRRYGKEEQRRIIAAYLPLRIRDEIHAVEKTGRIVVKV